MEKYKEGPKTIEELEKLGYKNVGPNPIGDATNYKSPKDNFYYYSVDNKGKITKNKKFQTGEGETFGLSL